MPERPNAVQRRVHRHDDELRVNGSSAGPDPNWDNVTNVNARMKDGVVGICQYNPSTTWATTISGIRGQLDTPKFCP